MRRRPEPHQQLAARGALLVALLRREKHHHERQVFLWGGLGILAWSVAGVLMLALAGALAPALPRPVGLALGGMAWAGLLALVWRRWVRPWRAIPNLATFSRQIEERRDFKDMLRAALEFSQSGVPSGGSLDLAAAAIDRAYEEARALQLTQLFHFPGKRRDALVAAGAAATLAVLGIVLPQAPGRALRGLAFAWPTPGQVEYGPLEGVSGDITVLAGESATVEVRDRGPLAPEMLLRFNDTGDLWKTRALLPRSSSPGRDYAFRFEDVRDHITYRFESGRRRTPEHRITVVQRPIVGHLQLRLVPPAYTGRAPATLEEGRGDAVALRGTRVEIEAAASSPLASAMLVPEGEAAGAVTLGGPLTMQTAGKVFRAAFTLRSDLRYHFDLVDSLEHTNADPVTYQISATEDRAPYVEVRVPGQDSDLPPSLRLPLVIFAADDFGISRLTLVYRRERQGEDLEKPWVRRNLELRGAGTADAEGRPLGPGPVPEILASLEWSLADVGLFPGDVVTYYAEVEDNDAVSGHKTARSPAYRLRLQTLAELYARIHDEDQSRTSKLDDVIEKGKQLQEKYEKLARELKKNPDVDWKKQKDIENALEKQKQLSDQVREIAADLAKEAQRLQDQQLVSQEIAQKMDEIHKLLDEVENDTLRQYMQRLQEAMKQISPEEIQRAMEKMQLSQEEFLKRLERTKALLEQLKREQKLDSMVERLSKMLQNQEQLEQGTRKLDDDSKAQSPTNEQRDADRKEAERMAREQKDLAEQARDLQQELDKLAQEFGKTGPSPLDEASKDMQQQDPAGQMQQASEGLQQQNTGKAQKHQQNASRSLRSLYQQLMNAQQAMSMQAQMEAAQKLQEAARQTLDVSFRQEGLARQAAPAADYEGQGELASQQQTLLTATGKVVNELDALAQKSLRVPPVVPGMLGQAMLKMREGVGAYEKGNTPGGRLQGEAAFGDLNRAVIELSRASAASSCQNPSGGLGASQRLEDLMGQQMQLNDATRRLQEALPNAERLTPEERAQMSRLLGEQRSIEKELQDVQRQAAEKRELIGRLDKTQEEMREVIKNMESETVSEETLRLQERIVSRMLDANRSLHKRDFSERRESRTAEDVFSKGGKPLPENDRLKKLRRDIERALGSGTPEEYEELVRQYFRAIAETQAPLP